MSKSFTRTIITTTATIAEIVIADGKITSSELGTFNFVDTVAVSDDNIIKLARKELKTNAQIVVTSKTTANEVRVLSFDDFVKYSTVTTRPTSQQKADTAE